MTATTGILRKTMLACCIAAMAMVLNTMSALAVFAGAEPIIYPAKGQSKNQTEKDKYECYQWAKGQTGFDPMQAPAATTPPPQQKGGAVKGAAVGAVAGVAIGAAAGDAGKGAAIGAVSGGVLGGARRQQSRKAQDEWEKKESAGYEQRRNEYNRAWGACMEGRGYTVK
jgi:Glycine zipper